MQNFLADIKPHFNLRQPSSKKATPIYLVVFIGGKQYKLATGVKVYPDQWSKSKQVATISNINSRLDNKNNRLANKRLSEISSYYSDFIDYLCSQDEAPADIVEVLKSYIYKDMASKQSTSIDVAKTIRAAFNYYYTYIHQPKESTLKQAEFQLNVFLTYIKEKKLTNAISVFSQTGLNDYKAYLIGKRDREESVGNSRINQLCQLLERLINNVLAVNNEYQQYRFTTVKYVKIEDKRQQDDVCRFPLYDDEIAAIKACTTLTEKDREYRSIFLLQCASGQRISDILQLLRGKYEQKDDIITLQTIKKGTYAQIYLTDEIKQYLSEISKLVLLDLDKFNEQNYNKAIKNICQKSSLVRVINWKDSRGSNHSNPLWEVVVSHDARHTFITNKVKEGVPYETLCLMTGHSDDRMIKDVYANLTKEDKRDKVANYYGGKEVEIEPTGEQVNLYNELFAISELNLLLDMRASGVNIFDQPEIKTIYKKLTDISLLSKAVEQFKGTCPDIDNKLSELIWVICRANYNTKAYNIFQYKCLKLGLTDIKPIPEDELGYIWEQENKELADNWQLEEYLREREGK